MKANNALAIVVITKEAKKAMSGYLKNTAYLFGVDLKDSDFTSEGKELYGLKQGKDYYILRGK